MTQMIDLIEKNKKYKNSMVQKSIVIEIQGLKKKANSGGQNDNDDKKKRRNEILK